MRSNGNSKACKVPMDDDEGTPVDDVSDAAIARAAEAIRNGDLVVYPTETVYGLGADALDPHAIDRVFTAKRRSRDDPLSLGAPTVEAALEYVRVDPDEQAFMNAFLPGPVTVVVARDPCVPDALTGGRDRVGIRVPDHPVARSLLEAVAPVTATSANVSGGGSITDPSSLDARIHQAAAVVLDAGRTPGTESTVVDPHQGTIHRRGALAEAVESWLTDHGRMD